MAPLISPTLCPFDETKQQNLLPWQQALFGILLLSVPSHEALLSDKRLDQYYYSIQLAADYGGWVRV